MPTILLNGRDNTDGLRDENAPEVPLNQSYISKELATRQHALGYGSLLGWLPNPDPILRKTGNSIEVYKDLLADAHTGGAVEGRKAATLSLEWMLSREGVSENSVSAPVVCEAIERLDVRQLITDILDGPLYGYVPIEVNWRIDEFGWAVPEKTAGKPPEWFVYDQENNLRFLGKSGMIEGDYLPPRKFLVSRHGADYNNQYGTPVLSRVFWPVTFKRGTSKYWVEYLEKFGGPWVAVNYPDGMAQAQIDELLTALNAMSRNGMIALPDSVKIKIEVVATSSNASGLYREFIETSNQEISKAIVGHTGGVESTPGKLGSEDVALGVRSDIVLSDKALVSSVMNQLIDWIYELNFPTESERVRFVLYQEEDVDAVLATRDKTLVDIGVKFTKEYIKNAYDLKEDDFELGEPPAPAPAFGEQAFAEAVTSTLSLTPAQEALEKLPGMLSPEVQQNLMKTLAAPLVAIVKGSTSYAEAMTKVARAYPSMDSTDIEAVFERMLFVADVMGRNEEVQGE